MIDNAVNLCLDIVFIQWLGWGIEGSSTATVVGHLVGIAIMCRHFRYKDNHLRLTFQSSLLTLQSSLKQILSQGAPLAIASVCLTLLLFSANNIVLSSLGRVGIFAFAVCMNLLQIYNLFLAGVCRTIQSLGAIQIGKGDNEAFRLVLTKSFTFITVAMLITCVFVWIDPQAIARFFGANEADMIAESSRALRIFALSFIPFCYIYTLMIVYKLYGYHKMALFMSFALSLTVIPVLWIMANAAPDYLWYSYLIAYVIEVLLIVMFHKMGHINLTIERDK
jgi:Na+-driven multidrug efflux pump